MNLMNKSRAALEKCRPAVIEETEDSLLVRCLDSYDLWTLKADESLTPCLKRDGFWESWITSWFTRNVEEGDFVVDVGANCGYYTMLFERLAGPSGRVVAYEASPVYAELLEKTKTHNNANFVVENVALSDKPGSLTLTYPGGYTGSASVVDVEFDPKYGELHYVGVTASTLDLDFYSMDTPDLIKIDAESAEELIWNGGKELLSRHDAPVVVLEYTPGYSKNFNQQLFDYGSVTRIGTDGKEYPINIQYLDNLRDWDMLIVRQRRNH